MLDLYFLKKSTSDYITKLGNDLINTIAQLSGF